MADKLTEAQRRWLNGKMAEAMGWHKEEGWEGYFGANDKPIQQYEGMWDPTHNFDQAVMVARHCCEAFNLDYRDYKPETWTVKVWGKVEPKAPQLTGAAFDEFLPATALCLAIMNMMGWEMPE